MSENYSVQGVSQGLKSALSDYLQAQYHIRDDGLVAERRALFDEPGFIAQRPHIEATPSYAIGQPIQSLQIPAAAKELLQFCSTHQIEVPAEPYVHQAKALEAFLGRGEDVLAATGTGSGKTEIFLLNILGQLAQEAATRKAESCSLPGCRALLLYPMNALVTDQLGRIRRLLGNPELADELERRFGRMVRFGMYTSRTPFPGEMTGAKCSRHLTTLFEDHFLKYDTRPDIKALLQKSGRWPCKDLKAFYAEGEHFWDRRLKTQPKDTELLIRHEMQQQCPDLLITNYSMLEYMMLRPIERRIFEQTKVWLAAHRDNQLTLVLDEAHLYRGTGGAEVAMLIRRLIARLGVSRDKFRCILTSASMGKGKLPDGTDAGDRAIQFANELTGVKRNGPARFYLIRGEPEKLSPGAPGSPEQGMLLASFDLSTFQQFKIDEGRATAVAKSLMDKLGLAPVSGEPAALANELYDALPNLPVVNLLIASAASATEFLKLAGILFPKNAPQLAADATQSLLALANFARSNQRSKVLLPARLHMFFRGLHGLYVCINARCTERSSATTSRFGKLWSRPQQYCGCGARVFELLTHRDCGTEYLRAYVPHKRSGISYLFQEKESDVGYAETKTHHQLREIHLLVGNQPHANAGQSVSPVWIHIMTGQVETARTRPPDEYLPAFVYATPSSNPYEPYSFDSCPVCLKGWRSDRSKIMDLKTKGEQPFAALTRNQLFLQPPTKNEPDNFPNGGRKVLLFSDGRQKAARLARDIPREIANDSFRECLALAVTRVKALPREPAIATRILYLGFLDVVAQHHLSFFDGDEQKMLLRDVYEFSRYKGLGNAITDWEAIEPLMPFKAALLRQLCAPYYSIPFATAGWLAPRERWLDDFLTAIKSADVPLAPEDAKSLVTAWVAELASDFAISGYSKTARNAAAGYRRDKWGVKDSALPKGLQGLLEKTGLSAQQIATCREQLFVCFGQKEGDLWDLHQNRLLLNIDLKAKWYQCNSCLNLNPVVIAGRCPDCAEQNVELVDPDENSYLRSRKGNWRKAIRECLEGRPPKTVNAEEHTAQLSYRDAGTVLATTEQHELLFQDIIINHAEESPVDILSATTTMEVGIDIGSLVAVGLRNVPPQRENYQQRAGRAGRRGSAVSSVVTYCHGGPHDSHYFQQVEKMVSGEPRPPMIKVSNPKIVGRHVHAYLVQTFFQRFSGGTKSGVLNSALGATVVFFGDAATGPTFAGFKKWMTEEFLSRGSLLAADVLAWVPEGVDSNPERWLRDVASAFLVDLELKGAKALKELQARPDDNDDPDTEEREDTKLLDFLFTHGFLPTYAFPTDLSAFNIEGFDEKTRQVVIKERPQQSIAKALTEYAPGRLVVVDKKTYKCRAVTASTSSFEPNRAAPLFQTTLKRYVFCNTRGCSFVREAAEKESLGRCPLCGEEMKVGEILRPEVFLPERGQPVDELDSDQDLTFASPAQFPIPVQQNTKETIAANWTPLGPKASKLFDVDRKMIILNKGDPEQLEGFTVCRVCGFTELHKPGTTLPKHDKPYNINRRKGAERPETRCSDSGQQVYLGSEFTSDLMILRISGTKPLELNPNPGLAAFAAMQHAMRTVAEALSLAAGLRLQLDPAEFSSGFRVFPSKDPNTILGEIYLFDTLSGGAGYSNVIGEELQDVLTKEVAAILGDCNCARSCYDCLRHYGNQFFHNELDRHLGQALIDYALKGQLPLLDDWAAQMKALKPLEQMLSLAGCATKFASKQGGVLVPLVVTGQKSAVALGTCHGLYANDSHASHPLTTAGLATPVRILNEFLLTRNLPAVVRDILVRVN
jgi:ATP-dependent helicase YprA (DUF1998 family)